MRGARGGEVSGAVIRLARCGGGDAMSVVAASGRKSAPHPPSAPSPRCHGEKEIQFHARCGLFLLPACGEKVPGGRMRGARGGEVSGAVIRLARCGGGDAMSVVAASGRKSAPHPPSAPSPRCHGEKELRICARCELHLIPNFTGEKEMQFHARCGLLLLPACGEKVPGGRMRGARGGDRGDARFRVARCGGGDAMSVVAASGSKSAPHPPSAPSPRSHGEKGIRVCARCELRLLPDFTGEKEMQFHARCGLFLLPACGEKVPGGRMRGRAR
jgi:hypothetical protein